MLEIKANSQSVKDLNKELDKLQKYLSDVDGKELNDLDKSLSDINDTTKTTIKTISSLESTLGSLNDKLKETEIGTQAYRDLEIQVIATSGELKNLELAREALDSEQFASEAKSVAGGLGDIAGGLAFIGASSGSVEKIVQTIAQVEGITKLATGAIEAYSSGTKILNSLIAKGAAVQKLMAAAKTTETVATGAQTVATGAQTAATTGATTTQLGLNAAMLANPIFLLIAGIAAIVAAFAIFGGSTRDVAAENDALNDTLDKQNAILDRNDEKIKRGGENRLALAKASGASEKEILDIQLDNIDKEEEARNRSINNFLNEIERRKEKYKAALKEEDFELAKSIRKEIEATRNKYKDLKSLDGQFKIDKNILTTQFETDTEKEEDKTREDNRNKNQAAYEKRLADQEKYNNDRISAARKIKDLELSLLEDGENKSIQITEEKTKRELQDLEKQYGDVKYLNEKQTTELNTLKALITNTGNTEVKKISDKYRDEEKASYIAFSEELKKLIGTEGLSKKELLDVQYASELQSVQNRLDKELISIEQFNLLKSQLETNQNKAKGKIDDEYNAREKAARLTLGATDLEGKLAKLDSERILELDNKEFTESEKILIDQKYYDVRAELIQAERDAKIKAAQDLTSRLSEGLSLVQDLSDNIFANEQNKRDTKHAEELSNLTEGTAEYEKAKKRQLAEDEKVAKKQFEINKKLQIAQAIMTGVQSVLAAFSSGSHIPLIGAIAGPVYAGLAAVAAAANIAKIRSSTYGGGGGGSAAAPSTPDVSSSIQAAQPQFNLFGQGNDANTVGPGANQNNQNNNQTINVNSTVSVSEITETQNKVAVQEERASL